EDPRRAHRLLERDLGAAQAEAVDARAVLADDLDVGRAVDGLSRRIGARAKALVGAFGFDPRVAGERPLLFVDCAGVECLDEAPAVGPRMAVAEPDSAVAARGTLEQQQRGHGRDRTVSDLAPA